MAKDKDYEGIPGTIVFDAVRSRRGYHLDIFFMSLMKDSNRDESRADPARYLKRLSAGGWTD